MTLLKNSMRINVLILALMTASTFATMTSIYSQQDVSAQGVIVPQREEFDKLSEQFQQDVLALVGGDSPSEDNAGDPPTEDRAVDPPDPDKLARLFDNYEQETFRIFGVDPPTELEPPDPDLEPPDPDAQTSDPFLKEPGKLE